MKAVVLAIASRAALPLQPAVRVPWSVLVVTGRRRKTRVLVEIGARVIERYWNHRLLGCHGVVAVVLSAIGVLLRLATFTCHGVSGQRKRRVVEGLQGGERRVVIWLLLLLLLHLLRTWKESEGTRFRNGSHRLTKLRRKHSIHRGGLVVVSWMVHGPCHL